MKRLAVSILFLLSVVLLIAQPRLNKSEHYLGFHGGLLMSRVSFSPQVEQYILQPFMGGNAGLVYRYFGHKYTGLQVELNWMQRGFREQYTDYRLEANYLEIPIFTHIYFGRKVRGYLNIGPQIGLLVHQKSTNIPTGNDLLLGGRQYLKIEKPFDWAIAGGLGLGVPSKAGTFGVEARFNYSFGGIYSTHVSDYFSRANHMNLSVNFVYLWKVK